MKAFRHLKVIDPEAEWKQGFIGSLTRLRTIVIGAIGESGVSILSFLYLHWVVGVLVIGFGIFATVILWTIRIYRIQRMKTDICLHEFCHNLRDDLEKILAAPKSTGETETVASKLFEQFHESTVQQAALFFRELTGDPSVACAVRIAETIGDLKVYVTAARSDGMERTNRSQQSKPLPFDKGLASHLRSNDYRGVFLIADIVEAINDGYWMETPNDQLPDVKKLMVAPINGYDSADASEPRKKSMLGIFYVTSRNRAFQASETIPLKALVDLLGLVYPIMLDSIYGESGRIDDIPKPPNSSGGAARAPTLKKTVTNRSAIKKPATKKRTR